MRAVVEHHEDSTLPNLKLIICKGHEDVTIKVGSCRCRSAGGGGGFVKWECRWWWGMSPLRLVVVGVDGGSGGI